MSRGGGRASRPSCLMQKWRIDISTFAPLTEVGIVLLDTHALGEDRGRGREAQPPCLCSSHKGRDIHLRLKRGDRDARPLPPLEA